MRVPRPLECAVFGAGAVFFAVQLLRRRSGTAAPDWRTTR
ncbi:hypothetical protein NUM_06080 [Actinocatenispora comari]|uniref:Uncharacterized protein n=1 Tax=Actinocatenispora comari TaxID=2807577 RepID=A0A8J4AAS7_9ACTN|nr:hypothetical protein NUM_06080 [Actinocatenispora comari]